MTNWVRDKGFGMGSKVGAIPSAVGGIEIQLSHVGTVFPATGANLARWREWLRYVHADQIWVWGLFCFLGMFLNVNLATAIIPHGTDLQGLAAGAYQAEYLAQDLAGLLVPDPVQRLLDPVQDAAGQHRHPGAHHHRRAVDVEQPRARMEAGHPGDLLRHPAACSRSGASSCIRSASPFQLFKILANMAGIVLMIAGVQIFLVNRRFLPPVAAATALARERGCCCARRSMRSLLTSW